jgi:hypothetical protein
VPLQQHYLELPLKQPDLDTQSRLRDMQFPRSTGHVSGFDNPSKILQLANVDEVLLLAKLTSFAAVSRAAVRRLEPQISRAD